MVLGGVKVIFSGIKVSFLSTKDSSNISFCGNTLNDDCYCFNVLLGDMGN